jgi:8-oxo-dGTP diphosphatase
MHVISVAYLAFAPDIPDPKPGSNASSARLMTVEEALAVKSPKDWAFDHKGILGRGVIAARNKLEYTSKAIDFLPDEFTIPELKAVYEAVWGQPVDAGNFYRKVKNTSGFIEATLGMRGKAQLFRGNKDVEVYPPIRRGRGDA